MVAERNRRTRITATHSLRSRLGLRLDAILRIAGNSTRARRSDLWPGLHAARRPAQDQRTRSTRGPQDRRDPAAPSECSHHGAVWRVAPGPGASPPGATRAIAGTDCDHSPAERGFALLARGG